MTDGSFRDAIRDAVHDHDPDPSDVRSMAEGMRLYADLAEDDANE